MNRVNLYLKYLYNLKDISVNLSNYFDSLKNTTLSYFYSLKNTTLSCFYSFKDTILSFFDCLKDIDLGINWSILLLVFIFISFILIGSRSNPFILMRGGPFRGISQLNVDQKIARIQSIVDADPQMYRLTQKILGQYYNNLSISSSEFRTPYNGFLPYTFVRNVDIHLSCSEQIRLASIIDRDLSHIRRTEQYIIIPHLGLIQHISSKKFIAVQCETIIIVAKAEYRGGGNIRL